MTARGRIIAAHGRHYLVESQEGPLLNCFSRGKKSELACGDWVHYRETGQGQGVIEKIEDRKNLLYRSNQFRRKLIAANTDQIVFVVATEPAFSSDLITRALLAAESQGIAVLIVLNKSDLIERLPAARKQLECFQRLGYRILELSARHHAEALRPFLSGQTSILVGQSGMGKSTLVNSLLPGTDAATREISSALDSGKHTTTHAQLYHLDPESHLIDSPGLQEFGLHQLDLAALERGFSEFHPYLGQCRFRNCRHGQEPGCALQAALSAGEIDPGRFASFKTLALAAAAANLP